MANLILNQINKIYDNKVTAVEDFNLKIEDKEFIVFVGPSGCGKSTTLRMIAGLEEITSGELYIDDDLVNNTHPKNRDIAMVFQNYALYPHMTVYENMAFALKLRKLKKKEIDKKVREASSILGLDEFLERKPKALSGGQRQRVALGRAIVRDAKVFLMDEPLSNLDAKLRVQMRAEIQALHNRLKTTTIYVTHDQTEAMTMATRLVVMKDGLVQQVGTPKEVYDNPVNTFVAGFIGAPAMNFIRGEIQGNYFVTGDEKLEIPEGRLKRVIAKGYENHEVILGIRPENLHDEMIYLQSFEGAAVDIKVEVAELMGAETLIHTNLNSQKFIARLFGKSDINVGDNLKLVFDLNKAHFFDTETEEKI